MTWGPIAEKAWLLALLTGRTCLYLQMSMYWWRWCAATTLHWQRYLWSSVSGDQALLKSRVRSSSWWCWVSWKLSSKYRGYLQNSAWQQFKPSSMTFVQGVPQKTSRNQLKISTFLGWMADRSQFLRAQGRELADGGFWKTAWNQSWVPAQCSSFGDKISSPRSPSSWPSDPGNATCAERCTLPWTLGGS